MTYRGGIVLSPSQEVRPRRATGVCLPPGVCKLYSIADNCCLKSSAQRSDYYLNPVILNRTFQCSAEWELGTCMRNLKF